MFLRQKIVEMCGIIKWTKFMHKKFNRMYLFNLKLIECARLFFISKYKQINGNKMCIKIVNTWMTVAVKYLFYLLEI